ncbi:hypothetical protein [Nitrosomonas sp. Nm132]|jgi:hypothetical protein|nr:hypothetical protein [Nitrosomonas sp. Nm132]
MAETNINASGAPINTDNLLAANSMVASRFLFPDSATSYSDKNGK